MGDKNRLLGSKGLVVRELVLNPYSQDKSHHHISGTETCFLGHLLLTFWLLFWGCFFPGFLSPWEHSQGLVMLLKRQASPASPPPDLTTWTFVLCSAPVVLLRLCYKLCLVLVVTRRFMPSLSSHLPSAFQITTVITEITRVYTQTNQSLFPNQNCLNKNWEKSQ